LPQRGFGATQTKCAFRLGGGLGEYNAGESEETIGCQENEAIDHCLVATEKAGQWGRQVCWGRPRQGSRRSSQSFNPLPKGLDEMFGAKNGSATGS
jgi:hypothetical protein